MTDNKEEFVSEALTPTPGTADASAMAKGEPGLPKRFTWRKQEYRITGVIRKWKTSSPCHHGGNEIYLRRHWYKILTDPPMIMTIYCDRQGKLAKRPKARWWVYTIEPS
ncbi:MAG TPA: cytoplasmic protein [Phycisphaerae bacterium]|nr:cytoplasmic protein [Phycisphaerae bacterium]